MKTATVIHDFDAWTGVDSERGRGDYSCPIVTALEPQAGKPWAFAPIQKMQPHRSDGGIDAMSRTNPAISSGVQERRTRVVDGGRLATERPGRHSRTGRIGRGAKPPPQFGQTFWSMLSTQSAQTCIRTCRSALPTRSAADPCRSLRNSA